MSMHVSKDPSWKYPYFFVLGLGVTVLVNSTLIYFAATTFHGLKTKTPYLDGLSYNYDIKQENLWTNNQWDLIIIPEILSPHGHSPYTVGLTYDLVYKDKSSFLIQVEIGRYTTNNYNQYDTFVLSKETPHNSTLTLPYGGAWIIRAFVINLPDSTGHLEKPLFKKFFKLDLPSNAVFP